MPPTSQKCRRLTPTHPGACGLFKTSFINVAQNKSQDFNYTAAHVEGTVHDFIYSELVKNHF
jgi:hypothetical protein